MTLGKSAYSQGEIIGLSSGSRVETIPARVGEQWELLKKFLSLSKTPFRRLTLRKTTTTTMKTKQESNTHTQPKQKSTKDTENYRDS